MRTTKGKRSAAVVLVMLLVLVSVSVVRAIPPDPDNAALLYYQALLIHHEPDKEISDVYQEFVKGQTAPTDEIQEYVQGSHAALDYALLGAKVESCDWGLPYSKGFSLLLSHMSQLRSLSKLLIADARLLASQGHYELALERCLTVQRMAQHIGDDTFISYLVSLGIRNLGYACMRDVIGQVCDDPALLRGLRDELARSPGREISAIRPLKIEREIVTDLMRMDNVKTLVEALAGGPDEEKLEEIATQASEKILGQARRMYSGRVQAALKTLSTPMPYEQAHAQLKQLENASDTDDPASSLAEAFAPALARILTIQVRNEAHASVIKAGVEICLQKAISGQLPSSLPADAPKDPFSGKDFEYERTDDGFVLRCRGKDLDKDIAHEYAFTLK